MLLTITTSYAPATDLGYLLHKHPEGRKAIFLGDLVDRGLRILDTYQLVRHMVEAGSALSVPGNHEAKLVRKRRGRDVAVTHGLQQTLAELERLPADLRERVCRDMVDFFDGLVSHYVLDDGRLVVAHAGMKASLQGRASRQVREFALYGETTGETDAYGLPVRHNWAAEYRGPACVVHGHTPVPESEWLNRTINIDTGCVFGGKLTALRYPERELVSVPAARTYTEPTRPFLPATAETRSAQQQADDLLDVGDVLGKHVIHTHLWPTIVVREEHSAAALEVMSRRYSRPGQAQAGATSHEMSRARVPAAHLRPRVRGIWGPSGPWRCASWPWGSRHWNAL